jgi:hypothetical protein
MGPDRRCMPTVSLLTAEGLSDAVPDLLAATSLQVQDASKGMAGSQSDPASLMRVLMKHGRMEQAAAFALQYLAAWQTQVHNLHDTLSWHHVRRARHSSLARALAWLQPTAVDKQDMSFVQSIGALRAESVFLPCRHWTLSGRSMQLCGSHMICCRTWHRSRVQLTWGSSSAAP